MDANGQRFWMLAEARHFAALRHAVWDASCRVLRLASERSLTRALAPAEAFAAAQSALESVPRAVDAVESVARWDAASGTVIVASLLPGDAEPSEVTLLALAEAPSDLCAGADGVLYLALPGRVRLHDLRGRWADAEVALGGFAPWRLAPHAEGGVWVMERGSGRLARLTGRPRRTQTPQPDDYDASVFRPSPENPCAPRLALVATPVWQVDERPLALAAGPDGALGVLGWRDGDGHAALWCWDAERSVLGAPRPLQGADYAYALAWTAPQRVAVRVPGRRDAPAYDLAQADGGAAPGAASELPPLGEVLPLSELALEAPFCNGAVQPPLYPSGARGAEPLHALSLNHLARRGEADNFVGGEADFTAWLVDSLDVTTVWHRLYAEAAIPAQCGFVVWLAASNEPRPPPTADRAAWHAHGFGRDLPALDDALRMPQWPQAVWEREASELPGHPGLLAGAREPGRRGLFSVLIQNSRQRVRQLVGRYLWVRVVLYGDGRAGPEIAALRAWGSRFSYAEKYLPRLYRESLFGDAAALPGQRLAGIEATHAAALDAGGAPGEALRARLRLEGITAGAGADVVVEREGALWLLRDGAQSWRLAADSDAPGGIGVYRPQASPADFNARLLANFEGLLTPLEDRVAAAHLVSDPAVVPEANLGWLAGWIGVAFDPALPQARRRDWLRAAPDLARRHGTRDGLRLALDVASDGGVRGGEIIVIENFRLRRILATLLGVDLADESDPLLPGLQVSGNSVVGDTLVLGDRERVELLALFRDDPEQDFTSAAEDAAVLSFYERLAHRATVLVHREVQAQDFALIRRIAALESPAHVEVRVVAATWPLLVGIASLVGVDTYLGPPRQPRAVQLERSALGVADFLISPALLDPRLSGVASSLAPPQADAGVDRTVASGSSFVLDAGASRAAPGRTITEYRWRWLPPDAP